jgi:hypothetical protein
MLIRTSFFWRHLRQLLSFPFQTIIHFFNKGLAVAVSKIVDLHVYPNRITVSINKGNLPLPGLFINNFASRTVACLDNNICP